MIKWIVCDMDGTLLDPHDKITPFTQEILMQAQQKGIRLILASGRSYSRLQAYADQLQMGRYSGMFIEINGTAVYNLKDKKREIIQRLNQRDIQLLFDYFRQFDVEIMIYHDQEIRTFIPKSVEKLKREYRKQTKLSDDYPWTGVAWQLCGDSRDGYPIQRYIGHLPSFPFEANKIVITQEKEEVARAFHQFQQDLSSRYEITRSCPRLAEINPKGISKGAALKRLMECCGIESNEVLVFGDGENDMTMFDCSDYAYAMGNAEQHVKDRAKFVCEDNAHDGLAKIVKEFVYD